MLQQSIVSHVLTCSQQTWSLVAQKKTDQLSSNVPIGKLTPIGQLVVVFNKLLPNRILALPTLAFQWEEINVGLLWICCKTEWDNTYIFHSTK